MRTIFTLCSVFFIILFSCITGYTQDWVTVSGRVTYQENPIDALVLVNGQYFFTSWRDGLFEMNAPLDDTGRMTLFAFALTNDLVPFKQVITSSNATNLDISMSRVGLINPDMTLTAEISPDLDGWVKITGTLSSESVPVCAMIFANDQYTFSDIENGYFEMTAQVNEYGLVEISCFADGFMPYRKTINKLRAKLDAYATSSGWIKLSGKVEMITLETFCPGSFPKPTGCVLLPKLIPADAIIDAHGRQTSADIANGSFELEVLPDTSGDVTLYYATDSNIRYKTTISQENIIPWVFLSVNQTELTMLSDTTEIVQIVGGKAPYQVSSLNESVATVSVLGQIITITGLIPGQTTIHITDSESYETNVEITVIPDGTGHEVQVPVRKAEDVNNDSFIDSVTYYTYTSYGLLKEEADYDNNGTIDSIRTFLCDDDALNCTKAVDYTNDGITDTSENKTYDAQEKLIRVESLTGTIGPEYIYHYSYDDQNNITISEDIHKDGIIDSKSYITHDMHGHKIKEEIDEDNDGSIDYTMYIDTYDAYGNKIRHESGDNNSGTMDFVITYEYIYNDDGKPIQCKTDSLNNGSIERIDYYEYNEDGNLSVLKQDLDNDGVVERTTCFGQNSRVESVEQLPERSSVKWERRYFEKQMNMDFISEKYYR
ncbi:MAG: hypothetical protein GY749_22400 [Desulfobacteraceae bacterium]|nr:hypothetical protein [Desulfobacteraceae bacterium]